MTNTRTTADNQDAAYRLLDPFVGKWRTEGLIPEAPGRPSTRINGTDTYEWLPGGYFLLHKVDVQMGDDKNESIEIIGFDKPGNRYPMRYFDNKGNTGLMQGSVHNGTWTFQGERMRFTGRFSEDGNTLSGSWEQSTDGRDWEHLMDIRLTRQER